MNKKDPDQKLYAEIEGLRGVVKDLKERSNECEPLKDSTLEYLDTLSLSLEELRVAQEELDQRNQELMEARDEAEQERQRYLELFEQAPDGYVVTDPQGVIREMNQTATLLFGYPRQFITGKPLVFLVAQNARGEFLRRLRMVRGSAAPEPIEIEFRTRSGETFPASITLSVMDSSAGRKGLRWSIRDITGQRRTEDQLRKVSLQLLKVQEEERKSLSRDLHDSVSQSLTAVKYGIENFLAKAGRQLPGIETLDAAIDTLQSAIGEIRRIYTNLRPPLLDELGIGATLSWFCREYQKLYPHVQVGRNLQIPEEEIPFILKLAIFRIIQEAFHNVAKHSRAKNAVIELVRKAGGIELSVSDDGVGFDRNVASSEESPHNGFGLISMKERAELSGGVFSVQSSRTGTSIRVFWPARQ